MAPSDSAFAGSIPQTYQTYLVPLIFEAYAADMAARLAARPVTRVLEIAAGTGVVTRALVSALPQPVTIVAGTSRPVEWRQADATQLPFDDGSFDADLWDRLGVNEFADVVTTALESVFPTDPPRFLARTPYSYFDDGAIARDLRGGGFTGAKIDTVPARSRAASARVPAIAYCQGTPLRSEIEARDPSGLSAATDVATEAIAQRFGRGAVDAQIQAKVVTVER